jgi:hypothetical protein
VAHFPRYLTGAILLLVSCSTSEPANRADAVVSDSVTGTPALVPSLAVRVAADTVHFTFEVRNATGAPVSMDFRSAQRYDFEVRAAAGEVVWQWSTEQMFGQALGTETLAAGDSLVYREQWVATGRTGTFEAVARLTSTSHPIELETEFEVGGGG